MDRLFVRVSDVDTNKGASSKTASAKSVLWAPSATAKPAVHETFLTCIRAPFGNTCLVSLWLYCLQDVGLLLVWAPGSVMGAHMNKFCE